MRERLVRCRYWIWILFLSSVFLSSLTLALLVIDLPVAPRDDADAFLLYLDEAIPAAMQRHGVGAAAVGLIRGGEVVHLKGYGYADADRTLPVTEDTVFQVASISKPVTAWGVMALVEQGLLDLDAPVSTYLTRWQLPPSEFDEDEVTVRRLLSHSSGMANVGGYAGFDAPEEMQTLEASLTSPEDADPEGARLIDPPGAKYRYSGGGYTVLQLVIEEVTGLPFETAMHDAVLDPLGMAHSSFAPEPDLLAQLSVVYDTAGDVAPSRWFAAKAAAGLHTTVADLAAWAAAMMPSESAAQGRGVLQPETLQAMFLPQPEPKSPLAYGLGYQVQAVLSGDVVEVHHTGSNLPGWRSLVTTVPETGDGLVLLTNAPGGAALRHQIRSAWIIWVTDSSTLDLRIQKGVNIAKVTLPVWLAGTVVLLILRRVSRGGSRDR